MTRLLHAAGLLSLCALFLSAGCRTANDAVPDVTDDVRALVAEAGTLAREAVVARQTSALALENALAARDKAETLLLTAFREGGPRDVGAAKTKLAEARAAADRTLQAVDSAIGFAMQAVQAAASARTMAGDESRPASDALKRCIVSCRETVRNAKRLAEDLKQEWLVADLSGEARKVPPKKP